MNIAIILYWFYLLNNDDGSLIITTRNPQHPSPIRGVGGESNFTVIVVVIIL